MLVCSLQSTPPLSVSSGQTFPLHSPSSPSLAGRDWTVTSLRKEEAKRGGAAFMGWGSGCGLCFASVLEVWLKVCRRNAPQMRIEANRLKCQWFWSDFQCARRAARSQMLTDYWLMVRQLGLTNIDTYVYPAQPSSVLLKAWLLIGQWRVDKPPWRAYALLMDDRYCPKHARLSDIEKPTVRFTVGYRGEPLIYSFDLREEKSHQQFCTFGRAAWRQRWFTSAWSFCGKMPAGPHKHWPVHRPEAGWRDNNRLSPPVSEPSSQVSRSNVTWKNVGCRCWWCEQHADEPFT